MGQTFTSSDTTAGVTGINDNTTQQAGPGVHGKSAAAGVWGESTTWHSVVGLSTSPTGGAGVMGGGVGPGVIGTGETWHGVYGESKSTTGGAGVWGEHKAGGIGVQGVSQTSVGVQGNSPSGRGVAGFSDTWQGVYGFSKTQAGVVGESNSFDGVFGTSHNPQAAGVSGHNPGGLAGFFDGNVSVSGNVTVSGDILLPGAGDCAEQFEVTGSVGDPGTVMVFDDSERLSTCTEPYDRRVAGVVSGANRYRPGLILNSGESAANRRPIALIGRVYCKVDASYGAIEAGDLLTTSPKPGHAMKAADQSKAFGATLGKALRPVREGQDLIPVLVALQ
jgi:hypothetical protein